MSCPGPVLPEGTFALYMQITCPQPGPLRWGCPALLSWPQGLLVLGSVPLAPHVLRSRLSPWSSTISSAWPGLLQPPASLWPHPPSLGNRPASSIPHRITKRRLLPALMLQKPRAQCRESQHQKEADIPAPGFQESPWPATPFFDPQHVALVLNP